MQSSETVIGSYRSDAAGSDSMIGITLFPRDLAAYWSRCGLTADFSANFCSFRFPNARLARNTLSVIMNEIVENAVKFSSARNGGIVISLFNLSDSVIFEVENYVDETQRRIFIDKAQTLLDDTDIEVKYFEALNRRTLCDGSSGLGLLTILHDFKARIGIRAVTEGESSKVSVQVHIRPEEVMA